MPTANANVLRDVVRLALQSSTVADAAEIDQTTWAADPDDGGHVFDGDGGYLRGRNRGRLPFVEFWLAGQDSHQLAYDGGIQDSGIRVRVHVGGRDQATDEALAQQILFAAIAAVRSVPDDYYTLLGDERVEPYKTGPWGHQLDAHMSIEQVYGRDDADLPTATVEIIRMVTTPLTSGVIATCDSVAAARHGAVTWRVQAKKTDGTRYQAAISAELDDAGTAVEYAEVGADDAGTLQVTFSADLSGGSIRLRALASTSGWTVYAIIEPEEFT